MTYLKVFDNVSNIERTVTQKAFDIITKNKRNPRYKFIEYVDEIGQPVNGMAPVQTVEKKTEPEKSVEAAAGETVAEGVTVIRKKPGPKPKANA